jgi:hypothetical protein
MIALGWQEARRIGHHWVGEEHVLLALARGDGVVRGAAVCGREAGGDVALVWRPRLASSILHRLGVDRIALIRDLATNGVAVPRGEPEPLDLRRKKRVDVPFEHLTRIVSEFPRRLPDGSSFGFNLDPKTSRAWILVDEEVDAAPLVAAILESERDSDG